MLVTNKEGLPTALTVEQPKVGAESSKTTETTSTVPLSTSGTKPLHYEASDVRRQAHEDYKKWHRTLGQNCFAYDCDLIEARKKRRADGTYEKGLFPVCMTETTSVKHGHEVDSDRYFDRILERLEGNGQTRFLEKVAQMAGIKFYVIVYDYALTRFLVYEPSTKTRVRQSKEEHAAWLRSLEVEAVNV